MSAEATIQPTPEAGSATAPDTASVAAGAQTAAATTNDGVQSTETNAQEAGKTGGKERPTFQVPDKSLKDAQRMAKLFPGLQKKADTQAAEIERLRSELAAGGNRQPAREASAAVEVDPLKHPAVAGLRVDEDGLVDYHGTWLAPETVIKMHEQFASPLTALQEQIKGLQDELSTRSRNETAAQEAARIKEAEDGITNTLKDTISEMLPSAFPGLTEKQNTLLSRRLFNDAQDTFADLIDEAKKNGELSAETFPGIVQKSILQAFDEGYEFIETLYEGRQLEHNREYAEKHPVKPGGTPGVQRTKMPESPADRDKLARETAERLMANMR